MPYKQIELSKQQVVLLAVLIVLSLIPLWSTEYFPSQNGPAYLSIIQIFKNLHNPAFNYTDYYELHPYVIPNLLFNVIIYIFSFIFPLLVAEKIALSVYVILWPISVFYFISRVDPSKTVLGFISFLYIYNWFLFRGYFNFCLALALFFFWFGYWYQHKNNLKIKNIVNLNILSLLLYLSHLYVFLLLFFTLAVYILVEKRSFRKILNILKLCLPSVILLLYYLNFSFHHSNWVHNEFTYHIDGIADNPLLITFYVIKMTFKWLYCFSKMDFWLTFLPHLFIIFLIIKKIMNSRANSLRTIINSFLNNKFLAILLFLLIFHWSLPWSSLWGWNKIGARAAPFLFVFSLAFVDKFSSKSIEKVFVIIVMLTSVSLYTLMTKQIIEKNNLITEFNSGIARIERNKTILPMLSESSMFGNRLRPLIRAVNYYNIAKGGANPYTAAMWNTLGPVWYKHYPINDFLPQVNDKTIAASIQRVKEVYDYVLLWRQDTSIEQLLQANHFNLLYHNNRLKIYSNIK